MNPFEHLPTMGAEVIAAINAEPLLTVNLSARTAEIGDGGVGQLLSSTDAGTWRGRIYELSNLATSQGVGSISSLLQCAFDDSDIRVRGAAWVLLSDVCQSAANPAAELVGGLIRERFDSPTTASYAADQALADRWLSLLDLSVRFARSAPLNRAGAREILPEERPSILKGEPAAAEKFFSHRDPAYRYLALWELARNGHKLPWIVERIMAVAKTDPVALVRHGATFALGVLFAKSRDTNILQFLASIVDDENEATEVRTFAYNGLLLVDGRSASERPHATHDVAEAMRSVDWAYVKACRDAPGEANAMLQRGLDASGGALEIQERLEDAELRRARHQVAVAEMRAREEKAADAVELANQMKKDLNDKELEVYRDRCERYPANLGYKYEFGVRLCDARNYAEASHVLHAARDDPEHKGNVLFYLGVCYEATRQHKLALSYYEQSLEQLDQRELDRRKLALYRAGVLAMEWLKDYEKAAKHFHSLAAHGAGYKDLSERLNKLRKMRAN